VGRDVLLRVEKPPARPGATVLAVRDLAVVGRDGSRRLDGISFTVRAGEIVGIAGVEGNGQAELVEALAGLAVPAAGAIELAGEDVTRLSARRRRDRGVAHVPEDRHRRGLLLDFDLDENCILGVHHRPPAAAGPLRAGLTGRRSAAAPRASSPSSTCARPSRACRRGRSPAATSRS
jgi:simple sugar transport system ATP-binding protein